jgi:dihydropyrimidine dehydrogenase (NAD+) subunit PreA
MEQGRYDRLADFRGRAVPNLTDWQYLNLNYQIVAAIDQDLCIKCGLCHIACEDTAHQAIAALRNDGKRRYEVIEAECVGCNLCMHVCPVEGCIAMKRLDNGKPALDWTQHPNNPMRKEAAE